MKFKCIVSWNNTPLSVSLEPGNQLNIILQTNFSALEFTSSNTHSLFSHSASLGDFLSGALRAKSPGISLQEESLVFIVSAPAIRRFWDSVFFFPLIWLLDPQIWIILSVVSVIPPL